MYFITTFTKLRWSSYIVFLELHCFIWQRNIIIYMFLFGGNFLTLLFFIVVWFFWLLFKTHSTHRLCYFECIIFEAQYIKTSQVKREHANHSLYIYLHKTWQNYLAEMITFQLACVTHNCYKHTTVL